MSLIKRSTDLELPKTVKVMIYGQAGMGKTTLALSTPSPLLIDFDGGVRRVSTAYLESAGIVQVSDWAEVKQLLTEDLSEFRTVIVDTVGKMMDYITAYVCGGRAPQMRDWTAINREFQWLCSELGRMGKHCIFVAHRDTRREGEETVFVPTLREKNLNTIVTELDLLGYLEMRSENGRQVRTVTFDPTSRNEGKNTCGLPSVMQIPNLADGMQNDFLTKSVIIPYQQKLEANETKMKEFASRKEDICLYVAQITDAEGANSFSEYIKEQKATGTLLAYARSEFSKRVAELGLAYDKRSKRYTHPA